MDLSINVKERPTGTFTLGAGYSGYDGAIGTVQVSQNNLFGTGQRLMGSVRVSTKSTYFDIRFTEPRVNDTKISAGIDLFKWEREYDDYTRDSFGGALRISFSHRPRRIHERPCEYMYDDTLIKDVRSWSRL